MEAPSLWETQPRHERTRSHQSRPPSHSQAEPDQPDHGQSGQPAQLSSGRWGRASVLQWRNSRLLPSSQAIITVTHHPSPVAVAIR